MLYYIIIQYGVPIYQFLLTNITLWTWVRYILWTPNSPLLLQSRRFCDVAKIKSVSYFPYVKPPQHIRRSPRDRPGLLGVVLFPLPSISMSIRALDTSSFWHVLYSWVITYLSTLEYPVPALLTQKVTARRPRHLSALEKEKGHERIIILSVEKMSNIKIL